ncbi:MAG TPA: insulinase family protein, partial [Planctomycetota bacterium]|nr:insulinase family protein [Planctomycetota bacterium]
EVAAIGRDELQDWFGARVRPEHTTLALVGAVDPAEVADYCEAAFRAKGPRTPPAAYTVHDSAGPIVAERRHPRVGAPFVTVAIKAPPQDSVDWLPFVIAMGVVKLRCATTFTSYRGGEAQAGFPFFWFDYRHGDGFALINRRGVAEGEGDVPRDAAAVRSELHAMIKRLRTIAPSLGEIAAAAKEAATVLLLPPWPGQLEAMTRTPALLMPRAELLVMADVLGWSAKLAADVGRVPVADVQRALAEALADDNLHWFTLLPEQ